MPVLTLAGGYPAPTETLLPTILPPEFSIRCVKTQEELDSLTDIEYMVLRTLRVDRALIERNPSLTLIQRWGVGYDTVDIEAAAQHNVKVAIALGVNSNAVAELALLLMLALYRHLIPLHNTTIAGEWDRSTYAANSFTVSGKLLGLVGCGSIGRLVAQKAQALGAQVQYYDLFRLPAEREVELGIRYVSLEELLKSSDIVSLHLPLTAQTEGMIDAARLSLMRPNAILINTSRGGLIDERALFDALANKKLMGCGMDSFANEPYDPASGLHTLPNIIMTPHIGGSVADLTVPMVQKVAGNVIKTSLGQPLSPQEWVNASLMQP